MKKVKKLLTYLLTAAMLFAATGPATVLADDAVPAVEAQEEAQVDADVADDASEDDAVEEDAAEEDAAEEAAAEEDAAEGDAVEEDAAEEDAAEEDAAEEDAAEEDAVEEDAAEEDATDEEADDVVVEDTAEEDTVEEDVAKEDTAEDVPALTVEADTAAAVDVVFKAGKGVFPEEASYRGTLNPERTVLTMKVVPGETASLSDYYCPTRKGMSFVGWTTLKGGPMEYRPGYSIDVYGKMTLYAVYVKTVTVKFNAKGGTFPDSAKYIGEDAELSADKKILTAKVAKGSRIYISSSYLPTKGNKSLLGWSSSSKAKEPDQDTDRDFNEHIYKDSTFYAVWDSNCTVTFKSTGALYYKDDDKYVRKIQVRVAKGSRLSACLPTVYKKSGTNYSELGKSSIRWGTKKNTKPAQAFAASSFCINKAGTFYPVLNSVKITWDANGGKIYGKNKAVTECTYAALIDDPDEGMYREGYDFVGWGKKKKTAVTSAVDFNSLHATKDMKFYAIWSKNTYKVTVDANGGIFTDARNASISADKKVLTAYIEKGTPINNFNFSYKKNGQDYYNGIDMLSTTKKGKAIASYYYIPKKSMKFYVVTEEEKKGTIPVIYKANGGVFDTGMNTSLRWMVKGSSFYGPSDSIERKGYIMTGWYTKKKGGKQVVEGTDIVNNKLTVFAHWKKGVTIKFDANGGTFASPGSDKYQTQYEMVMDKGGTLDSIYNGFFKFPYSLDNSKGFAGWSRTKKGAVIDLSKVKARKNMTLYAIWHKGQNLADGRIDMTGKKYFYTGKKIRPKFTVYDRNGKKVDPGSYKVMYSDNITAGTGYVTVIGTGSYSGMLRQSFYIGYNKTSKVTRAKGGKGSATVACKKAKGAGGYAFYIVNRKTGIASYQLSEKTSAVFRGLKPGKYLAYVHPVAYGRNGLGAVESPKAANVMKVTVR